MSDNELFLNEQNPTSRRLAVLEDDGNAAWLYLSEVDSQRPVADAWVYNRVPAPSAEAIKSYRGGPPPAAQGYASNDAMCNDPSSHEWSFLWSSSGESVAVAKDGMPMAFIIGGRKGGYSRELVTDGPWGHPWSDELFRAEFDPA